MSAFADAPIEPRSVTRSRHVFTNAVSSTWPYNRLSREVIHKVPAHSHLSDKPDDSSM